MSIQESAPFDRIKYPPLATFPSMSVAMNIFYPQHISWCAWSQAMIRVVLRDFIKTDATYVSQRSSSYTPLYAVTMLQWITGTFLFVVSCKFHSLTFWSPWNDMQHHDKVRCWSALMLYDYLLMFPRPTDHGCFRWIQLVLNLLKDRLLISHNFILYGRKLRMKWIMLRHKASHFQRCRYDCAMQVYFCEDHIVWFHSICYIVGERSVALKIIIACCSITQTHTGQSEIWW